jgi:V-type H+-transporting ATPase subunit A
MHPLFLLKLVSKDSLSDKDEITLEVVKIICEDFLAQNGFTSYDKFCPFYKTCWMLKNICHYYNLSQREILCTKEFISGCTTFSILKEKTGDLLFQLVHMKDLKPFAGEEAYCKELQELYNDFTHIFQEMADQ